MNKEPDPLESEFQPSRADYDALRSDMKPYRYEEFNGRKWGAFEQAMHHKGIIRLADGLLFVSNPKEYTKYLHMYSKIQAKDDMELKIILDTMPEEREAHEAKLAPLFKEIKELIQNKVLK